MSLLSRLSQGESRIHGLLDKLFKAGISGTLIFSLIPAVLFLHGGLNAPAPDTLRQRSSALSDRLEEASSGEQAPRPLNANRLASHFDSLDYSLDGLRKGESVVPRVFLEHLPPDLAAVRDVELRKSLFILGLLPVILQENGRLAATHQELEDLRHTLRKGDRLSTGEREWLAEQFEHFGVKSGNWPSLLRRAGSVPVSVALAQAALESAWGTSRFAREGRALFGQWTWSADQEGLVPRQRPEGERYRVRIFPTLEAAVRSYMHTLNTHWAYRDFRRSRAELRARGEWPDGPRITESLVNYSTKRHRYTRRLRLLIRGNGLAALDHARLAPALRMAQRRQPGWMGWVAQITGQEPGR